MSDRQSTLSYRTGPFAVSLETDDPTLRHLLASFYPGCALDARQTVHNFHLRMTRVGGLRRWWRPQARFFTDAESPFEPCPRDHSFPFLEWGLYWCIATRAHQYLMLHAGALERGGQALLLPATPGSGKSTLTAALTLRGWRLLSDEFGLYAPDAGHLVPLPRAIPLKNRSIAVIREFAPEASLGPVFPKTRKGEVSHLRPPVASLRRQHEPAIPRWVVFPSFQAGHPLALEPLTKSHAFTRLAQNSFNYQLLHAAGFTALERLIRRCDCYSLRFGELEAALGGLNALAVAG